MYVYIYGCDYCGSYTNSLTRARRGWGCRLKLRIFLPPSLRNRVSLSECFELLRQSELSTSHRRTFCAFYLVPAYRECSVKIVAQWHSGTVAQ